MIMAYRITEEEYQAIKAKEKETKNKQISKKLKVLMLRYEGKSNPEIAGHVIGSDQSPDK